MFNLPNTLSLNLCSIRFSSLLKNSKYMPFCPQRQHCLAFKLHFYIICLETAMGTTASKINALDEYRSQIHEYGNLLIERSITPLAHPNMFYKLFGKWHEENEITKKIHQFTSDIIARRRKARHDDTYHENRFGKPCHAMLDTLLMAEKDGIIDATGIQEEVDTFIFGGYDTSMTAITFTLFMIAHHSDVQKRLYEEIIRIHGNFIPFID